MRSAIFAVALALASTGVIMPAMQLTEPHLGPKCYKEDVDPCNGCPENYNDIECIKSNNGTFKNCTRNSINCSQGTPCDQDSASGEC